MKKLLRKSIRILKLRKTLIVFLCLTVAAGAYTSFRQVTQAMGVGKGPAIDFLTMVARYSEHTKYDPVADKFLDFVERTLENFDFRQLYESDYLERRPDGFHYGTFQGKLNKDHLMLTMLKVPETKVPVANFGDFAIEGGLKLNDPSRHQGRRTFSGYSSGRLHLGKLSHVTGTELLDHLMAILDPANLNAINAPESGIFPGLEGNGKPESRKLLNDFADSLPKLSAFLNQLFYLKTLAKVHEHPDGAYTELNLHGGIKRDAMAASYPNLAKFLKDMKDLANLKITLYNNAGNRLLFVEIDSKRQELVFRIFTRGGKLVPFDAKDQPVFSQAFSLSETNGYAYKVRFGFKFNAYGLKFENRDVWINAVYNRAPQTGKVYFRITDIPPSQVSGAFYGIIPDWAIDIVIPGNMEGLFNEFMSILKNANGRGSSLQINWTDQGGYYLMHGNGETEFMDNRFVRFALKIVQNKVLPKVNARNELRRLVGRGFNATAEDVRNM